MKQALFDQYEQILLRFQSRNMIHSSSDSSDDDFLTNRVRYTLQGDSEFREHTIEYPRVFETKDQLDESLVQDLRELLEKQYQD